eukprot:GHVL01016295.1.p2 GENE.GHVL01016295.1~~GHVL01016295.1.p2  ORF type:complete len:100 (+),score=4.83 GHVL01016295.1:352-651(+)
MVGNPSWLGAGWNFGGPVLILTYRPPWQVAKKVIKVHPSTCVRDGQSDTVTQTATHSYGQISYFSHKAFYSYIMISEKRVRDTNKATNALNTLKPVLST